MQDFTVAKLKEHLKALKQTQSGSKKDLQARLIAAVAGVAGEELEDADLGDDSEGEGEFGDLDDDGNPIVIEAMAMMIP